MIPKILHFIWLGKHECPLKLDDYKRLYSDYEFKIWNDDSIYDLMETSKMKDLYYAVPDKYMAKSDIARMEILNRYGGIYFDCDIIPIKKLEDWFLNRESFGVYENEFTSCGLVSNGFLGSMPNSRITNLYIDTVTKYNLDEVRKLTYSDSYKYTGPYALTYIYMKYQVNEFDVFPSRFAWPITIQNINYKAKEEYMVEPFNELKYEPDYCPNGYCIDKDYVQYDVTNLIKDLLK